MAEATIAIAREKQAPTSPPTSCIEEIKVEKNRNSAFTALLALFLLTTAIGCSGGRNPDKESAIPAEKITRLAGVEFETPASDGLSTTGADGFLSGSGLLIAREPISDVKTGRHFVIRGDLAEGGSIQLIAFAIRTANGLQNGLQNGIEIELSRPAGSAQLKVIAKAGNNQDDWSQFFSRIQPDTEFEIGFDVHNDENGEAHILVWNMKDGANQEPFFDSALDVNGAPGKGFGRLWAVRLNNATLRQATVGEPRDDH